MKIFYENLDGISDHKCPDLLVNSSSYDYDIIVFTETWLNQSIKSTEFLDAQYTVVRKDRELTAIGKSASKGGGVLIAVRSNITSSEYTNDKMIELEATCVKISMKSGCIYIYCLYIQPSASLEIYQAHVDAIEMLMGDMREGDSLIAFGDFNLGDTTTWCASDTVLDFVPVIGDSQSSKAIIAREITTRLLNRGLFQMSNIPNASGNVLDLVYTLNPELTVVERADIRMLPAFKSDVNHKPLQCLFDCSPSVSSNGTPESIFCFKRANYEEIREYLESLNLSTRFSNTTIDIDEDTSEMYDILHDVFEKFVPSTTLRANNKPKWHDKQLSSLKNKRNKIHKRLCLARENSDDNLSYHEQSFLFAREEHDSYRKHLFSDYLREQAANLKGDPKSFWRHVNSKRVSNALPSSISFKDNKATSDKEKADLFATFFKSVYVEYQTDFDIDSFLASRSENNCQNIIISEQAVFSVLSTIDTSKGSGHDGISPFFLRQCAEVLAGPLSILFTRSLRDGIYPSAFKIGQITPIYKAGSRNNVENYRGVNVLPGLAKVFERVINNQLKLIVSPKISASQHGFVSNRNIETNVMELTTLAHKAFENRGQTEVFYADISKAFDTVNPVKLIKKLAAFGLSNELLRWFHSYLSMRKQYVKVGVSKSETFNVTSGVGQGTILGPLLFIIFFNDSDHSLPGVHYTNFADDKKIAMVIKNQQDVQIMQTAINKFIAWCDDNDLAVNKSKCKVMSFYTKKNPIIHEYTINDQVIDRTDKIRDLGILLDTKMNFGLHLEYIRNKAMGALQFVKRQSYYFDKDIIRILYSALVRSNVEFACAIWSPHHATNKSYIESTQKQFVMLLNGDYANRRENNYVLRPYHERCAEHDFLTLVRRRINAAALFIHAIVSGRYNAPHLRAQMDLNTGVRTLRAPEFIRLPNCRTDHSLFSPFNNACRIFNHAALFIDPTLPRVDFRRKLLRLPDTAFGAWAQM